MQQSVDSHMSEQSGNSAEKEKVIKYKLEKGRSPQIQNYYGGILRKYIYWNARDWNFFFFENVL